MSTGHLGAALALMLAAGPAAAADLALGQRLEYKHAGRGHEFHASGAAVAAVGVGAPLVTWIAQ